MVPCGNKRFVVSRQTLEYFQQFGLVRNENTFNWNKMSRWIIQDFKQAGGRGGGLQVALWIK